MFENNLNGILTAKLLADGSWRGGINFGTDSTIHWEGLLRGSVWLGTISSFEAKLADALGLVHGICHLLSVPGLDGRTQDWYNNFE